MITGIDPDSELFLANIGRVQRTIDEANREVSSGKRISTAADAPDEIGTLLQLRAAQQRNQQIQSNLNLAKTDADASDTALTTAIKLMERALTLASEGTNPTQTTDTRAALAQEVLGLQQQMVSASQTAVQGRFIFSGDQSDSAAYTFDITSTNNAVVQTTTAPATARIEDPAGGSFAKSKTAAEIFDTRNADGTSASDNVFASLNNLRLALLSGDPTQITAAIDPLKQANSHLNLMQSFYGSVENRIQSATDYAENYGTQLQTQISNVEDADVTSAALALTTASTHLQAAMEMRAKLPRTTLFDYLA